MINKIDYYCGALISHLLSNKVSKTAPALFDGSSDSKILDFCTDNGDYKLYVKYSGKTASTSKLMRKWDVGFTKKDIKLLENFNEPNKKIFVALICGVKSLAETEIAIVSLREALDCLGNDSINEQKRLTVRHNKGAHNLMVYGTMRDASNAIKVPKDFNKFFAINEVKE